MRKTSHLRRRRRELTVTVPFYCLECGDTGECVSAVPRSETRSAMTGLLRQLVVSEFRCTACGGPLAPKIPAPMGRRQRNR